MPRPAVTCRVCEKPHGAWPKWHVGTHCCDCHTSWAGIAAAHTMCCHRTFSSNTAADAHLKKGKCTDPAVLSFVLVERAHGYTYWTPVIGVQTPPFGDEEAEAA